VLAPSSVQEAADHVALAFELSEKYRTIAMVVADGAIGQMMEPCELPPMQPVRTPAERADWALTGAKGRDRNIITSLYLGAENLEAVNIRLQKKLAEIEANEVRWKEYQTDDAEMLLVAFGTMGRVCETVVRQARKKGIKLGLLRPVTLWPFPKKPLAALAERVKGMLVVEMNAGQMVEDVRLAVNGRRPVRFYGRMGGVFPLPEEILKDLDAFMETLAGQEN
jgi:2-oxoglutarate ferredoxin oxidoreductase subunit alpha